MTPAIWLAGIATASLFVSFCGLFYTWSTNRARASQQELENLRTIVEEEGKRRASSVGELRDRVTRVEAEVENLPDHSQMAQLTRNIQEVGGDIGGVREVLGLLSARIERIDNYLMNEKGRK